MKQIPITHLSSYLYCPIKFYIENVLKIVKLDQRLVIKGTLKHKAIEEITKHEKKLVESMDKIQDFSTLAQTYKNNFSSNIRSVLLKNKFELEELNMPLLALFNDFKPVFDFEAEQRAKNIFEQHRKTNLTGKELWYNLNPKYISEKSLKSKEFGLRGRIDRLELWHDKIVPIEFKNRESSTLFDSQKVQLGSYILLSNKLYEKPSTYGYVYFLKDNQKKLLLMNDFLQDEIMDVRSRVVDILEMQKVPNIHSIKVSPRKCSICPYQDTCKRLKQ